MLNETEKDVSKVKKCPQSTNGVATSLDLISYYTFPLLYSVYCQLLCMCLTEIRFWYHSCRAVFLVVWVSFSLLLFTSYGRLVVQQTLLISTPTCWVYKPILLGLACSGVPTHACVANPWLVEQFPQAPGFLHSSLSPIPLRCTFYLKAFVLCFCSLETFMIGHLPLTPLPSP